MNSDVTTYIGAGAPWQIEVCERLRSLIGEAIPGVEEKMLYNKPHFLKNGKYAAVVYTAKAKVSFMIFNASDIAPVKGVLRSMGNGDRKTADIMEGQDVDYDRLADILAKTTSAL